MSKPSCFLRKRIIAERLLEEFVDGIRYLPGYHMNKKNWYAIILDDSVATSEIVERIRESYALAL